MLFVVLGTGKPTGENDNPFSFTKFVKRKESKQVPAK